MNFDIGNKASQENFKVSSTDHSRGSDTDLNATKALLNAHKNDPSFYVPTGKVIFFGAAANAQRMSDLVDQISNGKGETRQATQSHDWVGRWIGGNAPTTDFKGGSMFDDAHSSYTGDFVPVGTWIANNKVGSFDIGSVRQNNWGEGHYSEPQYVMPTRLREQLKQQKSIEEK